MPMLRLRAHTGLKSVCDEALRAGDDPAGVSPSTVSRAGLTVTRHWVKQIALVSVSGDLDMLTAPELTAAISVARESLPAGVVVDLSSVGFFACAGMSVLVASSRAITPPTRFGVVVGPGTRRLLTRVGLDATLELYSVLDDAFSDIATG